MRLSEYTYRRKGCGVELEHVPTGNTCWFQGDDADELENVCERIWKLAQWKKMAGPVEENGLGSSQPSRG